MKTLLVFLFTVCLFQAFAQEEPKLIQLSGIVIDATTSEPLPYITVYVTRTYNGTASNKDGFFSLIARPGDTIRFQAVGYAKQDFVLPKEVNGHRLSAVVKLKIEATELETITVMPWPTREEFAQAFMELKVDPVQEITNFNQLGFKKLDKIVLPEPSLLQNPLSFLYDNVISELRKRQRKPWKVKDLPSFE